MPAKLTPAEISAALAELNAAAAAAPWEYADAKLRKEFRFADFAQAFGFMATLAVVAEGMNHHPEWANVYNRVRVDLTTHSAGGVTELDFALARAMENAARAAQ